MVVDHYKYLLTLLSLDIVLIKIVKSLDDLNKKNNVMCFCNCKRQYDVRSMQTSCCKKLIHKQCLLLYLKKYAMCPFCAEKVIMEDLPPQTPVWIAAISREESAEQCRKRQADQALKMVETQKKFLKNSFKSSLELLWHARLIRMMSHIHVVYVWAWDAFPQGKFSMVDP